MTTAVETVAVTTAACDNPGCPDPARWQYVLLTIREEGQPERGYRLCEEHSKIFRTELRKPVRS